MWFRRVGPALALWLLCAPAAWGVVIRSDRNASLYTGLARLPRFESVGLLTTSTSARELVSSGTLITPTIVLTAAHTLDSATRLTFQVGGVTYDATRWASHPNWTGDLAAGWDLGLLQLSRPVTNITPAVRFTGSGELGLMATSVGFGMTGTGLSGATTRDRVKRAGTNVLDTYYTVNGIANPRIMLSDFDDPNDRAASSYGSRTPTNLESLIAAGDSGGGLFINTRQGIRLAGVHTFGSATDGNNNADYGDFSGHLRVSLFNSWIDNMIQSFQPLSQPRLIGSRSWMLRRLEDESISSAAAVPEPASTLLAAVGLVSLALVGLAWRRRLR